MKRIPGILLLLVLVSAVKGEKTPGMPPLSGETVDVKVISIEDGRVRLSRKALIMEAPDYNPADYEGKGYEGPSNSGGGRRDRPSEVHL